MSDLRIIRGASPSRHGGVHWYEWRPKNEARIGPPAPDLFMLHPMPHDGSFFNRIAPFLAAGRTVIAPDYPGYGGSDALGVTPSIEIYAEAMMDTIRARDTHGKADLFGFHTGCLVATEMSLRYPNEVHSLVQVDVPFFDAVKRKELLDNDWAVGGFLAAFSYPCEDRYKKICHETLVVATASDLLEPSRGAAKAMPGGTLRVFPDIEAPALESGAAAISKATLEFLDQ